MTTETDTQAAFEKWLGARADDPSLPHGLMRDAFCAGVEADRQTRGQPAVGEEIHVHIEGLDVLTLPLASSGIGAPRFVVHVPAQPDVSLTPDVQTDRQGRVPSDEEIEETLNLESFVDRRIADDEMVLVSMGRIRAAFSRYGQPAATGKPIGYALIEGGEAVAFFNEAPTGHYDASAYVPVGIIGQPAASAELRPDEYDYFVDWYDKDAPDESEVRNFDMARHAWLAGMRFADLFPSAAPVAQEPVGVVSRAGPMYSHGTTVAVFEAEKVPVGTKLYAAPVVAQAQLQQSENQEALADTQRAIIEAAERRGYERAIAECGQDREDAERLDALIELCGHVENGTDDVVRIFQDDATHDWIIRVGDPAHGEYFHGRSIRSAIDAARAAKGAE